MFNIKSIPIIFVLVAVVTWSLIKPYDLFTWFLEAVPVIIGAAILVATYKSFQLTLLIYYLLFLHAIVLLVGAHYSYAEVPLFNYLKNVFAFERNNYDKVGHFMQGFVPAMVAREFILRKTNINGGFILGVIVVSFAMMISSVYEIIEWLVAVATGDSAEAFLGTQGDEWDTQKDMAFALVGSIFAVLTLSKLHNKQLRELK